VVVQGPQGLSKSYSDAINTGVASGDAVGKEYRINRYDSNGRLMRQQAFETDEHRQQQMTSDTKYTAYDKAGNVVSYTMTVPGEYTNTYTYERAKFDGYKEKSLHATSTKFEEGQTDSFYDVNGNLVRIDDHKKDQNDRTLINDLAGHALYVKQGTAIRRQVVVNGEVLGRYGIGVDEKKPRDKDGNPNFVVIADFTDGYQPITGNYPAASVGSYQVQGGDTLRSIARQSYGDEGMWYRIAESNGLSGDRDLRVGQTITIPSAVGTVRNNSGTFTPYDASKITGDTMPHMPTPHNGGGGCGGIGMLLVIIVAVVATVVTAGAAAIAMGVASASGGLAAAAGTALASVASGSVLGAVAVAVGAAVGSIVSQGVAMAVGLQDKFSWQRVGMSAIGSVATAALPVGAFTSALGQTGGMAVRAAVGNAIGQGIGVATGLQDKFDWRGVAASAAATFVSEALRDTIMGAETTNAAGGYVGRTGGLVGALGGSEAAKIAGSTVLGIASGATASLARDGKVSIQQVAVDAFGNALGESIAGALQQDGAQSLTDRAESIQAAQKELARLAEQYGGMDNVPMNLPEVQDALRIGRGNLSTVQSLSTDKALAAQIGRGAARAIAPVDDLPVVDAPVADNYAEVIRLPDVEVTGGSAFRTAARLAATAGGVVTGVFQSIGDGVIGAATLLNDALGAQRYMMLQTLSADLNQSTWGYEDRKKSFDTMVALGEGVKRIVDDPGAFLVDAANHAFNEIQSSLDTAEATNDLSDWFLYGAKVGHATMDVAGLIGGVAGLPKLATGLASATVNGARALASGARAAAQAVAPKVAAMAETYMNRTGTLHYAVPPRGTGGMGGSATSSIESAESLAVRAADGPPVPRIDVSEQFSIKRYNGVMEVNYLDAEFGTHGLNAYVDRSNRLSFEIRAQGDAATLGSGTDMFASLMKRLHQENIPVEAITGTWVSGTDSVNAAQFAKNIAAGMTQERAALNTWTGNMASRYGYTSVTLPKPLGEVQFAYFRKPG
jgi:hypothetical protein